MTRARDLANLGDGIRNGDISAVAAIAQSKLDLDIANAQIASDAAIAQSKLDLDIANAQIASDAAIAQSKLDLDITNDEIASDAAISASKLAFTQSGTGAVARSIEDRLEDYISVKDFGAVGNLSNDDTEAIQAAIDSVTAFGKRFVYFPPGNYKTTAEIVVQHGTVLVGAGSGASSIFANHNGNGIVFQPADAGSANSFLSGAGIRFLSVSRNSAGNGGSAIWVRQCAGFRALDVSANNHDYGIRITGGQLNTFDTIRTFCFSPYTGGPVGSSAGFLLEQADIGGGSYQPCFTVQIKTWIGSASGGGASPKLQSYAIQIKSIDGLSINGAYLGFYGSAHLHMKRGSTSDNITIVALSDIYFDGVENTPGGTTGTPRAFYVENSGLVGGSIRAIRVTNCGLVNCRGGQPIIDIREPIERIGFVNCVIGNCDTVAVNIGPGVSAGLKQGSYTFANNSFSNCLGGIKVTDVNSITVTSNTFSSLTGSTGINFNGLADKISISSNTFESTLSFPIANLSVASASNLIDVRRQYTGSYTPTAAILENVDSVTPTSVNYSVMNNIVHVFGRITFDPTASGTVSKFTLSLPVASGFTTVADAAGNVHSSTNGSTSFGGSIFANASTDTAEFNLVPSVTASTDCWFNFSYVIR